MATSDTCACTCMTTDSALSITANAISIVTLAYVVLIGIGYRVAAYQTAKERSSSLYVGTKTLRAHIDGISVSFNTYSEPIMISILNDTRDRLSQLERNLEKGDKSSDKWSMIWRQLRYTRRRDDWERDLDKTKLQVDLYQKYETLAVMVQARHDTEDPALRDERRALREVFIHQAQQVPPLAQGVMAMRLCKVSPHYSTYQS